MAEDPTPSQISLALEKAFITLPDQQREVLRLKFKRGWGYPEIAEATGQSASTVGYLVHHGLKNLVARIEKELES